VRVVVSIRRVDVEQQVGEIAHARGGSPHVGARPIGAHAHLKPVGEEYAHVGGTRPEGQLRAIRQSEDWRQEPVADGGQPCAVIEVGGYIGVGRTGLRDEHVWSALEPPGRSQRHTVVLHEPAVWNQVVDVVETFGKRGATGCSGRRRRRGGHAKTKFVRADVGLDQVARIAVNIVSGVFRATGRCSCADISAGRAANQIQVLNRIVIGVIIAADCQSDPDHLTKCLRVNGRILNGHISIDPRRIRVIAVDGHVAGAVELNDAQTIGRIAAYGDAVIDRPD
jgi:hypothetical protein